jgi:para-aminobenzoate synthetase/4-amino-4-deoxychorismate lyase
MLDDLDDSVLLYDATGRRWLRFSRPHQIFMAQTPAEVPGLLRMIEARVQNERRWAAGFLGYESAPAFDAAFAVHGDASFPCLWFGLFDQPVEVDLSDLPAVGCPALDWQPSVDPGQYRDAVQRVKEYIAAGDIYQANYTLRLRTPFEGDPLALFRQITHPAAPGYGALVSAGNWSICSASPELFFMRQGDWVVSRPMKGTARRGVEYHADLAQAEWLRRSGKNRAENVMITDMVRHDMGRIADAGKVAAPRLFDIEKYPTVWQMTSTVACRTSATTSEIFGAIFPASSITGAPKVRAMQIIRELEPGPRRIYTGSIGFLAPDGCAQFNVAIRTVLVDRKKRMAEYGVGGGIVWDSDAESEFHECCAKAQVLTQEAPDFELLETLRWTPEEGWFLLEQHLARLRRSADYFGWPLDESAVRSGLVQQAQAFSAQAMRVRLCVARGGGLKIEAVPLPALSPVVRVRLAAQPVDSAELFLYHKTTHRVVYQKAMESAADAGDVLLWNERGEITESTIANVVVEVDGRRYTPPLRCGLLAGCYREHLLQSGQVSEKVLRIDDVKRAAALYLVNSVRGMQRAVLDI